MGQQNQYLQNGSNKTDFSPISCASKEMSYVQECVNVTEESTT
jgi:hypothetical protein